jgi:hypothetical protein
LAKDCYTLKLDLLTNATVVDDAIRFVTDKDARGKSKSDPYIMVQEEKQQEQQEKEESNTRQRESESNIVTINEVF